MNKSTDWLTDFQKYLKTSKYITNGILFPTQESFFLDTLLPPFFSISLQVQIYHNSSNNGETARFLNNETSSKLQLLIQCQKQY